LKQLFEELKALFPVCHTYLKASTKLLKSHMFMAEKRLACGAFDKMKANLIANGRERYPDRLSPMATIHA
jgi:hypothetical protein